jgi:chemotaxis protein CheD
MKEIIDVNTGETAVQRGEFVLRAMAIGSCIVVAAYDSKTKNAGMAHIMLPGCDPGQSCEKTKYATGGIEQMLNQMLESGSVLDDIEVCLVGAGNVLQKEDDIICEDNIKSVTTILSEKRIPVRASFLGGYERKSVFLDAQNGCVSYSEGDGSVRLLWRPPDEAGACQSLRIDAPASEVR